MMNVYKSVNYPVNIIFLGLVESLHLTVNDVVWFVKWIASAMIIFLADSVRIPTWYSFLEMIIQLKRPEKEGFSAISTSFPNGEPVMVSTSSGSRVLSICLIAWSLWYGVALIPSGSWPTANIRSGIRRGGAERSSPSIL